MESIFLAKLLGLYFIIMGGIILIRRKAVMPTINDLLANRALLLVIGVAEIAAGLAIVIANSALSLDVVGLISLIGYIMIIEGIIYLAAPLKMIQKLVRRFNRPGWYISGGILSVLAGVYLAATGFGLL